MSQQGLISEHTWQRLSPLLEQRTSGLAEAVKEVMISDPGVESEELDTTRRESLRAQRAALTGLLRDGVISEEIYSQLVGEVDTALTEPVAGWPELSRPHDPQRRAIKRLMAAVIQNEDVENAVQVLGKLGFVVTRMPSQGGFLRKGNHTLLVGMPIGREEAAVRALKACCRKRVEYSRTLLHDPSGSVSKPIEININGATVFVFEIESYHEI